MFCGNYIYDCTSGYNTKFLCVQSIWGTAFEERETKNVYYLNIFNIHIRKEKLRRISVYRQFASVDLAHFSHSILLLLEFLVRNQMCFVFICLNHLFSLIYSHDEKIFSVFSFDIRDEKAKLSKSCNKMG